MNVRNVPSSLKLLNRKIVYNTIASGTGISRAEIARKTGISGATVIKIAEYLESQNIIFYEETENNTQPGRKPTPVKFNTNFAFIVAIYMEGFYASMGIINTSGTPVYSREYKIPDVDHFIKKNLYREIDSLIVSSGIDRGKIIGIGMAIPAAIDPKTRKVYRALISHSSWLTELETVVSELGIRYAVPVFIENDVNAAAYGEYKNIYGKITDSLVYISMGSGLGGGIILNRKLWHGQNASAGEFGYVILDRSGTQIQNPETSGSNGKSAVPASSGWLEGKTGIAALKSKFGFDPQIPLIPKKEKQIIRYICEYLVPAILNIHAVLDIGTVVLGGILSDHLGDPLVENLKNELGKRSPYAPEVISGKVKTPSFAGLSHIIMDELLDEILSR